jgi:hypothetical protein
LITDSVNQAGFAEALIDYYDLLNKHYPEKGILKLVGDRYCLSGRLRTILHRGIWPESANVNRQQRLTVNFSNRELIIDGYNVVFTLLNYKMGRPVFISTDNICRDAGSLFGKIRKQEYFVQSLEQIIGLIEWIKPEFAHIFFDMPVSFSAEHKLLAEKYIAQRKLLGSVHLVKSADNEIKAFKSGIICSSDSNIIDSTQNIIGDLPLMAIKQFYTPDLLNLRILLESLL